MIWIHSGTHAKLSVSDEMVDKIISLNVDAESESFEPSTSDDDASKSSGQNVRRCGKPRQSDNIHMTSDVCCRVFIDNGQDVFQKKNIDR